MRRSYLSLIVGSAFFCGFIAAHLIQDCAWNQGVQDSVNFKLAKPTNQEQPPAPFSPEAASAPAPTLAPPPSQQSEIPCENAKKKFQLVEEGTEQSPGAQDAGQKALEVANFKEGAVAPPSVATTQIPDAAPRSNDVASVSPEEEIRPTKEAVDLPPGPQPKEARTTAPKATHPQEILAIGTKNFPATSANDMAWKDPPAGAPPAQVVVQKGDRLSKIISKYYPSQEKLGLEATILANAEISREDVIFPGQTLTLPRINVSAQAVQLQDQRFYALYGRYYSTVSWEGNKLWLAKNQVRFIVRHTRESTGRVIHRVFLGGYETASGLAEAQRRLLTRGKRAWQGKNSTSPIVSGFATGEEISDDDASAGLGSEAPNPDTAVENRANPLSPGSFPAPEVKGATRIEAREKAVAQSSLERRFEGGKLEAPLKQFITCLKTTATVEWIVCRCRNVLNPLRYLISMAGRWQNIPPGNYAAEGNAGGQATPIRVPPEIFPPKHGGTGWPEPNAEGEVTLSPSPILSYHDKSEALVNTPLRRYLEIFGVLLVNKVSHFPEHFLQSVSSRENREGKIGFWQTNHEFLKIVEGSGYQALKTSEGPGEQEPLAPLPGQDSPEKALPSGTIRRYWDANGVLHIVNGELNEPNLGTAAIPAAKLKLANPSEREKPEKPLPVRKVSWPGQAPNPMPPVGFNNRERTLPHAVEGSIRGFRDAKGVLHIVNGEPNGPIPATATNWTKSQEKVDEGANTLSKSVSFPIDDQLPATPLRGSVDKALPPTGEGTIRRYRDSKGVLHIETVEYPKPGPRAAHIAIGTLKPLPDAGGSSPVSPVPAKEGQNLPKPASTQVVAFRDPQGRLIIRNHETETKGAGVTRWEEAMAQLAPIIAEASLLYGLPVPLIQAVIKAESNFYCWAVSPKGAMGLMQLMPETAASLGVKDPFNPRENILGGCRYLRLMLDCCRGSLPLALAAYNAGYQRVVSCDFQIPPIKETQGFVTEVLGRYQATQNMGAHESVNSGHLMPVALRRIGSGRYFPTK